MYVIIFTNKYISFMYLRLALHEVEELGLDDGGGGLGVDQGGGGGVLEDEPCADGLSDGKTASGEGHVVGDGAVDLSAAYLHESPVRDFSSDGETLVELGEGERLGTSVGESEVVDLEVVGTGGPAGTISSAAGLGDAQLAVGVDGGGSRGGSRGGSGGGRRGGRRGRRGGRGTCAARAAGWDDGGHSGNTAALDYDTSRVER